MKVQQLDEQSNAFIYFCTFFIVIFLPSGVRQMFFQDADSSGALLVGARVRPLPSDSLPRLPVPLARPIPLPHLHPQVQGVLAGRARVAVLCGRRRLRPDLAAHPPPAG